jgi:hypothetical protein
MPLAELKQLKTVVLGSTPKLTRASLSKVRKALPNCDIHVDSWWEKYWKVVLGIAIGLAAVYLFFKS